MHPDYTGGAAGMVEKVTGIIQEHLGDTANQTRDYRLFEDFAFYMMKEACKKRETSILNIPGKKYAFDSTT